MKTREIPKGSWSSFLETVANTKAFQPIIVRVESEDMGDQPIVQGLPLIGLSVEEKGSMADAIELTVSQPASTAQFTHVISHPSHVWVQENDLGDIAVLDIEDAQRVKTLIFFGVNMPELGNDKQPS
jgi:hypothetical protein